MWFEKPRPNAIASRNNRDCLGEASLPWKTTGRWRGLLAFLCAVCLVPLTTIAQSPRVIVIDPGHGGSRDAGTDAAHNKSTSNNATSVVHHILEKDVTLRLARLVAARIEASDAAKSGKVKVILTRDSDVNLDFSKRAAIAADAHAACFMAIHFNSDDSHRASGPRAVIQREGNNPNFAADKAFGLALAGAVEGVSRRYRPQTPKASWQDDHELHGHWGSYLFYQLNQNPATRGIPTCHLEVEFLDNTSLEQTFFVDKRDEIFAAWADAIARELIAQVTK